jgi:hypothetical protein
MSALRSAEIQPRPGVFLISSIRASVSMPRSPTSVTRSRPKRSRSLATWSGTVDGSAVVPGYTWTATGRPSPSVIMPYTTISRPFFPSRLCPNRASGQVRPSQ